MRVHSAAGALLAATVVASCASRQAQIEVIRVPAPGIPVAEGRAGAYQTSLAQIVDAFEQAAGLPRPEVALIVFPNRRSFEQGLRELGYPPALARSASAFNAIGGARAVLVNGGTVNGFDRTRRVRLLAHELVHTLQYRFSGGTRGASEQWLREGVAEVIACRITAHLGLGSFESLREDLVGLLAGARIALPPAPFDKLTTFPQWVDAQDRYEAPLYAQAFIAAELLIELRGMAAVVKYFEQFKGSKDYEHAFVHAFGLDRVAFERQFARRWRQTLLQLSAGRSSFQ